VAKTHKGAHREFAWLTVNEPRIDAELRRFLPRTYDLKAMCDDELGPDAVVPRGDGRDRNSRGGAVRRPHCGVAGGRCAVVRAVGSWDGQA